MHRCGQTSPSLPRGKEREEKAGQMGDGNNPPASDAGLLTPAFHLPAHAVEARLKLVQHAVDPVGQLVRAADVCICQRTHSRLGRRRECACLFPLVAVHCNGRREWASVASPRARKRERDRRVQCQETWSRRRAAEESNRQSLCQPASALTGQGGACAQFKI